MDDLSGRTAVITGGASGIGLAIATRLAADGMRLVLGDIEDAAMAEAADGLRADGAEVQTVHTDVTDAASVDGLRDGALSAFGSVHVVVNNAGVATGGPIWEIPLETWRWVMEVNVMGVVHGIHSFTPLLIEQGEGHIVNTASVAGLVSAPAIGPYNASKHAVVAISETLVQDLAFADSGVGASVLCPAFVQTRIHEAERNAPDDVVAIDTEQARAAWQFFGAMVESGIDATIVADAVSDAIRENRFYILTHPDYLDFIRARIDTLLAGGSPAPA